MDIEPANVPRYDLRPSRQRSYNHRLDHQMDEHTDSKSYVPPTQLLQKSTNQIVTAYIMTQMSATSGIKTYWQPAIDAIHKEFCQLHDKGVFEPKLASSLTMKQKSASLRAVNLIKEKRNGDIKGRTCADGSVQRSLYDKSETTSPTVANDALMYSLIIDAKERRDVATADVVGAYLNADMEDFMLMRLSGEAVGIMTKVNKSYESFVTTEKGKPVLYLELKKALYGCVKSALLWYELFTGTLMDLGFCYSTHRGVPLNPIEDMCLRTTMSQYQCLRTTMLQYQQDVDYPIFQRERHA
jgi:Reverse transcriptase (RNA-dependent DNA polymerase)